MWQVYVGVWDCYATEAFHNPEAYNLLFFRFGSVMGNIIKVLVVGI